MHQGDQGPRCRETLNPKTPTLQRLRHEVVVVDGLGVFAVHAAVQVQHTDGHLARRTRMTSTLLCKRNVCTLSTAEQLSLLATVQVQHPGGHLARQTEVMSGTAVQPSGHLHPVDSVPLSAVHAAIQIQQLDGNLIAQTHKI